MFDHNSFVKKSESVCVSRIRVAYVLTIDYAPQIISAADINNISLPVKEEVLKNMIYDRLSKEEQAHVMNITILSVVSLQGVLVEE